MKAKSVGGVMTTLNQHDSQILGNLPPVPTEARMIEQRGVCDHAAGTVIRFAHPAESPEGTCPGLLLALRPFVVATALGLGSADGYTVSCPSAKGTVWLVEARK